MHHRAANITTLGILGGGQLGMLLARAAQKQNLRVHLYLEKEEHAPALPYAQQVFMGDGWSDLNTLLNFATSCEVIALENEFIPVEILQAVAEQTGVRFIPDLNSYGVFQNKAREKKLAQSLGLNVGLWRMVESLQDVRDLLQTHKQLVLKTCQGGYDGYGNLVVNLTTTTKAITQFLSRGPVLAEDFMSFTHEVAVVVARTEEQTVCFPIAETIQTKQICHYVLAPARLPQAVLKQITEMAQKLVIGANAQGLFGIEFFITADQQVFYNETAPRPHNSAHFTLSGCNLSQFDMIINMAMGLPLTQPMLVSPVVGMLNLLGTRHGSPELEPAEEFNALKDGEVCLYGKPWSRPGRKMGHFNLRGENAPAVLAQLQELQQRYQL